VDDSSSSDDESSSSQGSDENASGESSEGESSVNISGDQVSSDSEEEEIEGDLTLTLAERRKRWELPPHLLPVTHPRYKPLDPSEQQSSTTAQPGNVRKIREQQQTVEQTTFTKLQFDLEADYTNDAIARQKLV